MYEEDNREIEGPIVSPIALKESFESDEDRQQKE